MKVFSLRPNPSTYSCHAYLVTGDWKRIEDVNTLVDIGTDAYVLDEIATIATGIGKSPIEQVIFTHHHFDHTGGLRTLLTRFNPRVRSFSDQLPGEEAPLRDGERVRIGDRDCEIIHVPGHSQDSICIYCETEKILFSGDTPLRIRTAGGTYEDGYVEALERLARRNIDVIYSGHDAPVHGNITAMLRHTLTVVTHGGIPE